MKSTKLPDNEEITPTKKLKQARLPFKILSEVSPKPTPQPRKRKLSAPEPEPLSKVGKITKENSVREELVIISDDDSKDGTATETQVDKKTLNPYVKLVDTVWKKKLQKSKTKKKRHGVKTPVNNSQDNEQVHKLQDIEMETNNAEEKEICREQQLSNGDDSSKGDNDCALNQNIETEGIVVKETKTDSKDLCENSANSMSPEAEVKSNSTEERNISKTTPKRTTKINVHKENSLNNSQISNSGESTDASLSTPRRSNRSLSVTNSTEDMPLNDSITTNLTPKQLQKKLESAKRKEEKEKEKLEREKKRILEKEERAKQRQEKEEQRKKEREEKEEAKKREKEEKEEQKRKEKEEKEKQKELEKKLREEKEEQKRKEKEEKEEQRKKEKEAKDEEKRKKQEALELERLDQEQKKKKAAEAFVSFFVPKQKVEKEPTAVTVVSKNDVLSCFTIKTDMRLAPTTRVQLTEDSKQELDNALKEQNVENKSLYLNTLKEGVRKALSSGKTWPITDRDDDDDVMIIEDELPPVDGTGEIITLNPTVQEKLRPKLLAFHENRRPPYWGTWRKKSEFIKPTKPFKMDEKLLDYDVDSDDDWEDEQEGESIDGSAAGSDDEQGPDDYEVDNEVFVPHGYLSDEEGTMDESDDLSLTPEAQKARLKHLEDEFESELKKPMEKLKPRLYGLLWETEGGGKPENCADALWSYFGKLAMIMNDPTPFLQPSKSPEEPEKKKAKKRKANEEHNSPKIEKKKKSKSDKDTKSPKTEIIKPQETKKNQPGINSFLTKLKNS